jgi:hypothetical protein
MVEMSEILMKASAGSVLMLLENCFYPRDDRVRQEARVLAAAGYQVAVICSLDPGQPWRQMLDGDGEHPDVWYS